MSDDQPNFSLREFSKWSSNYGKEVIAVHLRNNASLSYQRHADGAAAV
jgi:hypothetical protein